MFHENWSVVFWSHGKVGNFVAGRALFLVLVSTTAAEASPDTRYSASTSHVKDNAFRDVVNIFQHRANSDCIEESMS